MKLSICFSALFDDFVYVSHTGESFNEEKLDEFEGFSIYIKINSLEM